MLLAPMDENNTKWNCNCKQGFLRDVKNNSCHEVYRQGPCPLEYYFIPTDAEKEGRCEKNPCFEDRVVPFEGGCHPLYKSGPPCPSSYFYLGVDFDTFKLKCIFSIGHYVHFHRGGIINAPIKACPLGSRRGFNGCKRTFT